MDASYLCLSLSLAGAEKLLVLLLGLLKGLLEEVGVYINVSQNIFLNYMR